MEQAGYHQLRITNWNLAWSSWPQKPLHRSKSKIDKGDIQQINDFITYNLNIRQFAQDVVENTNDPELLKHFYKALNSVTIIDPTCGSGAFLFAAMNILEPLYEACLQRMEIFWKKLKMKRTTNIFRLNYNNHGNL